MSRTKPHVDRTAVEGENVKYLIATLFVVLFAVGLNPAHADEAVPTTGGRMAINLENLAIASPETEGFCILLDQEPEDCDKHPQCIAFINESAFGIAPSITGCPELGEIQVVNAAFEMKGVIYDGAFKPIIPRSLKPYYAYIRDTRVTVGGYGFKASYNPLNLVRTLFNGVWVRVFNEVVTANDGPCAEQSYNFTHKRTVRFTTSQCAG